MTKPYKKILTCGFILALIVFFFTSEYLLKRTTKGTNIIATVFYESLSYNPKTIEVLQMEAEAEGKALVPPFVDFESEYSIAPKYDLTICKIKKSMSTLMNGIGCVLYDTEEFMKQNRSIVEMFYNRMCADINEYTRINDTLSKIPRNSTKIAVIRDPISRFVSLFVDKCIHEIRAQPRTAVRCYNCGEDVECFVKKQYERFMELSKNKTFEHKKYIDTHAAPLSWNCQLQQYMKDYKIVKMSSDPVLRKEGLTGLMQILEGNHVPEDMIEYIRQSAIGNDSDHSTFRSEVRANVTKQIETNPVIRDYLKRIYLLDYIIFGFDHSELSI